MALAPFTFLKCNHSFENVKTVAHVRIRIIELKVFHTEVIVNNVGMKITTKGESR